MEIDMQKLTEKDIKIVKGTAIILILLCSLFSTNVQLMENNNCRNFFLHFDITKKVGDFCNVGIAVVVFLCGFLLDKYYGSQTIDKKQIGKKVFSAYLEMLSSFFFVYILVAATSFLGRSISDIYGTGIKKWIYAVVDALGLQWSLGTPTLNPTWMYLGLIMVYIFMTPFCVNLYRKYGFVFCVITVFLPYILKLDNLFLNYLGVFMLGIWCAEEFVLEKVKSYTYKEHKTKTMYAKLLVSCLCIWGFHCVRENVGLDRVMQCFLVLGIVYFSYEFISDVEIVGNIFAFLGKHSLNIWLIHNMLYQYYFTKQIYKLRYGILIFTAVLLLSLLVSVGIEWGKQKLLGISSEPIFTMQAFRNVLSKPRVRVIFVVHFCIGFCYIMFRVLNIRNMDTTLPYQILDSSISESLERLLFIIISIVMGGILIYVFWNIVYIFCQKWDQIVGKRLFFSCLIIGIAAIIVIYPGMYAYEVDNYITYRYAMMSYPLYWHHAYTSYVYLACHMFLPHPIAIPLVQFVSFLLIIFYAYNMSISITEKKWRMFYFLLLAVPEALYVALNPYRNCFYAILCLGLLIYVYFEFKQQKKLSRTKFVVLLTVFAFIAVWRSEGIIFSIILFAGIMWIVYGQKLKRVLLQLFLLLICIKVISIPQDLGSKKYWGSDYTLINCMNSLQSMLNADNVNLQYEGAESDLAAIETITPVEMIKESGIGGYRNYNNGCGRDINQSCASAEDQKAFLKAYMRLTLNNLPIVFKTKLQDYQKIILQEYPKKVSVYKGDYYVFPKGEFTASYPGYEMIKNSYATEDWQMSSLRNTLLSIIDCAVYVYFWIGTKLKITVAVRIWFHLMFCGCLLVDFVKSIAKRSKGYLFLFLIEAAIFLEYCAIVLVMPEPRAAYFYPMQFCIYFMVLSKICEWLKSDEKQKRQKGIEEVKQEQCSTATH